MRRMTVIRWILVGLTPLIWSVPCKHSEVLQPEHLDSTVRPFSWFNVAPALAEQDPPLLKWDDLRALNFITGKPSEEIAKYDGKTIGIAGFAVPTAGESYDEITEALIVPEPLMCTHVPPPLPNQLIHAFLKKPAPVPSFELLVIVGELKIIRTKSEYGKAGYEMRNVIVAPYKAE